MFWQYAIGMATSHTLLVDGKDQLMMDAYLVTLMKMDQNCHHIIKLNGRTGAIPIALQTLRVLQ